MKLNLNPHIKQKSTTGRPFRLSGLDKIEESKKWVGGQHSWQYIANIKYLDDNTFANLKLDYDNTIIKKLN